MIFVLSNRTPTLVGFWPFGGLRLWVGPIVVGALAFGIFLGLLLTLPQHLHWRRRARRAEKYLAEAAETRTLPAPAQPKIVR